MEVKDNEQFLLSEQRNVQAEGRKATNIWLSHILTRVNFCVQEANYKKLMTLDSVKRKRYITANRCYLCQEEETVEHLFLHSENA